MKNLMLIFSVIMIIPSVVKGQDDGVSNALDLRTRKAIQIFIRDAKEIAIEYENNGDLQKAKSMYEQIQRMDNRIVGIEQKINSLNEQLVAANKQVHMLDTARGWTPIGLAYKDRTFRVVTVGNYKMTLKEEPSASGFEHGDVKMNGMDPEFPLGALIGVYFSDKKPGKPFLIGKDTTLTASKNGILYLKVNVPPSIACEGVIHVGTSGWFNLASNNAPSNKAP